MKEYEYAQDLIDQQITGYESSEVLSERLRTLRDTNVTLKDIIDPMGEHLIAQVLISTYNDWSAACKAELPPPISLQES